MNDTNVVDFSTRDGLVGAGRRVDPDNVLNAAVGNLEDVVVLGFDKHGQLYVAASGDARDVLWLCESAKRWLLREAAGDDG